MPRAHTPMATNHKRKAKYRQFEIPVRSILTSDIRLLCNTFHGYHSLWETGFHTNLDLLGVYFIPQIVFILSI